MTVDITAAATPTSRLTRVPYSRRLSTSRPIWSVPSQWAALGGAENSADMAAGS